MSPQFRTQSQAESAFTCATPQPESHHLLNPAESHLF